MTLTANDLLSLTNELIAKSEQLQTWIFMFWEGHSDLKHQAREKIFEKIDILKGLAADLDTGVEDLKSLTQRIEDLAKEKLSN